MSGIDTNRQILCGYLGITEERKSRIRYQSSTTGFNLDSKHINILLMTIYMCSRIENLEYQYILYISPIRKSTNIISRKT